MSNWRYHRALRASRRLSTLPSRLAVPVEPTFIGIDTGVDTGSTVITARKDADGVMHVVDITHYPPVHKTTRLELMSAPSGMEAAAESWRKNNGR